MSYIKPGPNYKMSKQTKRSLATKQMIDPHYRGVQKRLMIQADLHSQIKIKDKRNNKTQPSIEDSSNE